MDRGSLLDKLTDHHHSPVIKKIINAAIYVETPISDSVSSENTSVSQTFSSDDLLDHPSLKTKRCTCASNKYKTCPCHPLAAEFIEPPKPLRRQTATIKPPEVKTKTCRASAKVTPCPPVIKTPKREPVAVRKTTPLKISQKSAPQIKNESREEALERERKDFKLWLINKKKIDQQAKQKVNKQKQELEVKELEKKKKLLENELNFQLWIKKKEEETLEKRIKDQEKLIADLEIKKNQVRDNEFAFNEWLEKAKNKQRPTPSNKGINSLYSSSSVAYVNPKPWNPVP